MKGAGPAGTQPLPATPSSEASAESVFVATQPLPAVVPSATPADAPAAVKSAPGVPGYAIAYTPKDGPSTPAVVIAPEARSEPENLRPMSLTVPSRARVTPVEAPTPAQASISIDDDFNPYAQKKGKGKLIGALLGGASLVAIGVFAFRALSEGSAVPATATTSPAPAATPLRVEAQPAPVESAQPAAPEAPTAELSQAAPPAAPQKTGRKPATVDKRSTGATRDVAIAKAPTAPRPKPEPVAAAPTRPAARPAPVTPAPSEASSPAAKPGTKGVIVRDAPF